jgi:hypothetical protein
MNIILTIILIIIPFDIVFTYGMMNDLQFCSKSDGAESTSENRQDQNTISIEVYPKEYILASSGNIAPIDWKGSINTTSDHKQAKSSFFSHSNQEPEEIKWNLLTDIEYELKFMPSMDTEMYVPIFTQAVKMLDGKEVIIEGYVIPFDMDEEEEILSLSANPYAACFFCGKASPASVMSLYLKEKRKRYYTDDFKKFKGTLHLNYDDPYEFYYILKDAEEI